jgi:hypothetical protein
MTGPARQQRKPKHDKPVGTEFATRMELQNKEEEKGKSNKMHNYNSKKKVILLPGPIAENKK